MRARLGSLGVATLVVVGAGLVTADPGHATRKRVTLGDVVDTASAAFFGPTYRKRRWNDSTYFQFYQPRNYRAYPLPRKMIRDPMWGNRR